jgi:hypothetical protein
VWFSGGKLLKKPDVDFRKTVPGQPDSKRYRKLKTGFVSTTRFFLTGESNEKSSLLDVGIA